MGWTDLFVRHGAFQRTVGADPWDMTTAGPLTLHLSRASARENTGLCLHRVYGFAYLPGTGLNGKARCYAEQVAKADPGQVRRVFGHLKGTGDESGAAGAVVFHDAWPAAWPRLVPDILNNHYGKYYQGTNAPGDWDAPCMVSFLAVAPGTTFRFAVGKRRADVGDELVSLARDWLTAALVEQGAGAETAAGYGGFKPVSGVAPATSPNRARFQATLELVTPAFLAGPNQSADNCDLRPATLRGLLRWWWRTLHAGFADVPTLRRLEAVVWGDTSVGGAVRVTAEPVRPVAPVPFDKATVARENQLPRPPDDKTSPGIVYASYGMDERKGRRVYLVPRAAWTVRFTARPSGGLPAEAALKQAVAALGLLCHLGGVGSKSRNGLGSLANLPGFSPEAAKRDAADFRTTCPVGGPFHPALADSLALEEIVPPPADAKPWLEVRPRGRIPGSRWTKSGRRCRRSPSNRT